MINEADGRLLKAASEGNSIEVAEALKKGANVNAREEYGDTALNRAAEHGHGEIVRLLLDAGADIENKGGADKTPTMNAALAGHTDTVKLLLERGARINRDLLSSVQLRVNILTENAEAGMVLPEAVENWKKFLNWLTRAKLQQDLPEIIKGLSAGAVDERNAALSQMESAANWRIDVSAAVARLEELKADSDPETRAAASATLSAHYARLQNWDRLGSLLAADDHDVKTGAIPALVAAAQDGVDITPLLPVIVNLLSNSAVNLRHDAAVVLGYAATNGLDVSGTIPQLTVLLSDARPEPRKIAAWALYRIAKYVGDISAAVPALQALLSDEDESVREMASEALRMSENYSNNSGK